MKAAESKFDFIVNTIPSIDENFFQNYFNCIDLGGTFVQVGQPDFDIAKLLIILTHGKIQKQILKYLN